MPHSQRPWWIRLVVSLVAGFGVAVVIAIAFTMIDIYLAGHGRPLLGRPWLDMDAMGVHLSRADVGFLVSAVLAVGFVWRRTARGGT
jgi:hypothetical protein